MRFDWQESSDGRTQCRFAFGDFGVCMTVRFVYRKWQSNVCVFNNDAPANKGYLEISSASQLPTKAEAIKHAEQALADFAGGLNQFTYYELNPVP